MFSKYLILSTILALSIMIPAQSQAVTFYDISDNIQNARNYVESLNKYVPPVPTITIQESNPESETVEPEINTEPVIEEGNEDHESTKENEKISKKEEKKEEGKKEDNKNKIAVVTPETVKAPQLPDNKSEVYFAGKGINIKNNKFSLNQGFAPTWTGQHTFNKNIVINNPNPSLMLDAKAGKDFWLGTLGEKDTFAIGIGNNKGKNVALSLQSSGNIRLASKLDVLGGGLVKDDLIIKEFGCVIPGEVRFEDNTKLEGIEKGDIFYDAAGMPNKIESIEPDFYGLKIKGQCLAEGESKVRIERSGLVVEDGNIGFGVNMPHDKLDVAGGDIRLSSKKDNVWMKIYAPEDSKAGIKLGTNENNEDLPQWQIYTSGKGNKLRIQGWDTSEMKDQLVLTKDGQMGVGVEDPQATLDIDGFMKLKPQAEAPSDCNKDASGTLVMTRDYLLCTCNGEKWVYSYASGSECKWDQD